MKEASKSKSQEEINKLTNKRLILMNDDFNTFDYVVNCLISLCDHEPFQAEQCAMLTHYKGECEVLVGENEDLELIRNDLSLYGLKTEII